MGFEAVNTGSFQAFGKKVDNLLASAKNAINSNTVKKAAFTALGIISLISSGLAIIPITYACIAAVLTTPILLPALLIAALSVILLAAYCGDKGYSHFIAKADKFSIS